MKLSLIGATVFDNTREGVVHIIKFTPAPTLSKEVLDRVARRSPRTNVVVKSDEPFQTGSGFILQTSELQTSEPTSAERPFISKKGLPQAGAKHLTFRNLPADRLFVLLITESK